MQIIGVDAGGTFTDSVVACPDGALAVGKALSTPGELENGVMASLDDAARAVADLARENVTSVAVALLWSVANRAHEDQLAALVREAMPDVHLSLSSDLVPKLGEYERTSTVVVDGTTVYAAEPDHSADEPTRFNPLQIQPRRPR